jgi:hypothetical protein
VLRCSGAFHLWQANRLRTVPAGNFRWTAYVEVRYHEVVSLDIVDVQRVLAIVDDIYVVTKPGEHLLGRRGEIVVIVNYQYASLHPKSVTNY